MTKFYETMQLQEAEIARLKEREADLLATAARYLERARDAEDRLANMRRVAESAVQGLAEAQIDLSDLHKRVAELEKVHPRNRVEMTGEGGDDEEVEKEFYKGAQWTDCLGEVFPPFAPQLGAKL